MSSVSSTPDFSRRAAARSFAHASIASTCLAESAPVIRREKTGRAPSIPKSAASRASCSTSAGSQPNLRDRSHTAPGLRNDMRSRSSARSVKCANFFTSSALSATKVRTPKCRAFRISRSRLIGWVWMQRSGATRKARRELHFAGGGQIEQAARLDDGAHRRRMRQRLQRIMQIDARQRPAELAELPANARAVDDQERRAKLAHQPADMLRLEGIDEPFVRAPSPGQLGQHGDDAGDIELAHPGRGAHQAVADRIPAFIRGTSCTRILRQPALSSVRRLAYRLWPYWSGRRPALTQVT